RAGGGGGDCAGDLLPHHAPGGAHPAGFDAARGLRSGCDLRSAHRAAPDRRRPPVTGVAVTGLRVVVAVTGVRLLILAALPANHATDDGEAPPPWMRSGSRWRHHAHRLRRRALRTVVVIGRRTSTVSWLRRAP